MTTPHPARGTAKVANVLPETVETLGQLVNLPVGTILVDRDGDRAERLRHGFWRHATFVAPLSDQSMSVYLPAKVDNHADLAGLELDGFHLGDLVVVDTNDFHVAVEKGTVGVVERIAEGFLNVRFRGGLAMPFKPTEVVAVPAALTTPA